MSRKRVTDDGSTDRLYGRGPGSGGPPRFCAGAFSARASAGRLVRLASAGRQSRQTVALWSVRRGSTRRSARWQARDGAWRARSSVDPDPRKGSVPPWTSWRPPTAPCGSVLAGKRQLRRGGRARTLACRRRTVGGEARYRRAPPPRPNVVDRWWEGPRPTGRRAETPVPARRVGVRDQAARRTPSSRPVTVQRRERCWNVRESRARGVSTSNRVRGPLITG
jgi:hypothetical protein